MSSGKISVRLPYLRRLHVRRIYLPPWSPGFQSCPTTGRPWCRFTCAQSTAVFQSLRRRVHIVGHTSTKTTQTSAFATCSLRIVVSTPVSGQYWFWENCTSTAPDLPDLVRSNSRPSCFSQQQSQAGLIARSLTLSSSGLSCTLGVVRSPLRG